MENYQSRALYELNKEIIDLKKTKEYKIGNTYRIIENCIKTMKFKELFGLLYMRTTRKNVVLANNFDYERPYVQEYSGRVAVYTCIIGAYDIIEEPLYISEHCDYYIFTDQEIDDNSCWKKIDIASLQIPVKKPNEINRYIKMHPHEFFPEYNYSLYVDGNIVIVTDVIPIVNSLSEECVLALHKHDRRDCAYQEMETFKHIPRLNKYYNDAKAQMKYYEEMGFPKNYGLFENPIILRKHNDPLCIKIMEAWWEELTTRTMRDQISLPFVLWKLNIEKPKIDILGTNIRENPRFIQREH